MRKCWYNRQRSTITISQCLVEHDKGTLRRVCGLRTSPKQWQEHLSTILQRMGLKRLKSDACIFANKQSSIYLM
eukprot:1264813-Amphidinium_carterae.1